MRCTKNSGLERPKCSTIARNSGLIAMVCSNPPEGRARWTVRLVAEEAVKRKLVPRVGRETIRILLLSHDLKPWREKNVVVADLDEDYIAKMEDVLEVYERPYDPARTGGLSGREAGHAARRCATRLAGRAGTGSATG